MRIIIIKFKNGKQIPIPVKSTYDINNIIVSLYKKDTENSIEAISVMPVEVIDYEKNRHLQCYN